MADTKKKQQKCGSSEKEQSCCNVEAVLSVDERGQMVLPKDLRTRANIKTGDKLALVSWQKDGEICCFALMKVEQLSSMVQGVLQPILSG